VNLDQILLHHSCLYQKLGNILALITLQLNHLTQLRVLDNSPIATKLLFEILEDFIVIELLLEALNCC